MNTSFRPRTLRSLVDNPAWEVLLDGAVRRGVKPKSYANLLLGDVAKKQNEEGLSEPVATFTIPASSEFVKLIENGTITSKAAKEMFPRVWSGEITDPAEFVKREGLAQSSDRDEIKKFVDEAIAANADAVAEIRKGKDRALQFLLGASHESEPWKSQSRARQRALTGGDWQRLALCATHARARSWIGPRFASVSPRTRTATAQPSGRAAFHHRQILMRRG